MTDPLEPPDNPFVGPRALEIGEEIFGREAETRKLTNLLLANRIVLLYSPSGAGKTSLIQAGLIPRLKARHFNVLPRMRLNLIPPAEVAALPGFNPYVFSALTSLEDRPVEREPLPQEALPSSGDRRPARDELPPHEALARMSLDEYLTRRGGSRLFMIFDQFEEILTTNPLDRQGKMAFFEQLGQALSQSDRWALFAIREDYLGGLAPYTLPIPTRFKDTFRLDLLEADAAKQVVQSTAALGKVRFTDEAARRLMTDLTRVRVQLPDGSFETQSGPYVEPVHLQVVCRDLWEKRDPADPDITVDEIEKIGDVDDALGSYYDNQVGAITAAENVTEWKVRTWCGTRLITESDIRSQVLMGPEESGGLANTAIQRLVDAHLVRREPRRGSIWFELAHDRLIAPIRRSNARWSEEHLSPWQRQAALWEAEHHPERLLLGGETLDEAIEWASDNAGQLSEEEVQFLDASKRHAQALQLDAERRRARTQQRFLILIGLALVAAVVLGIYSAFQTVRADRRGYDLATQIAISEENAATLSVAEAQARDEKGTAQAERGIAQAERGTADALRVTAVAQSTVAAGLKEEADANALLAGQLAAVNFARQLAVQGNSLLDSQPDLAGLLAAESYAITPTLEGRSLLLDLALLGLGQEVQPFGFPIPEPESLIMVMDLSPDGERLAWGTLQGYVAVWNYRTNAVEWNQRLHTGNVISLDFSPDGKWLASGGIRPELHITNVSNGREVKDLSESEERDLNRVDNRVYALAFHPDQPLLAAAVLRRIYIWRTTDTWEKVIELPAGPGRPREPDWIQELAWSPDGSLLASGEAADEESPIGGLVVWDPLTGQKKLSVEYERTITGLAWSPDSKTLVIGSTSGLVRRWDMTTGREVTEPAIPQGKEVYGMVLSTDGKILAVGGLDPEVILYDTRDFSVFLRIPNPEGEFVNDLMFSPHPGTNLLATVYQTFGSGRRRIALSLVTPQNPLSREIAKLPTPIEGTGGSLETGLRLLRSTADGILVEDLLPDGQGPPDPVFDQSGSFNASAISPSGNLLALLGQDGNLTVYELSSRDVFTIPVKTQLSIRMAFSPDEHLLATGFQGGIDLWDIRSGERTQRLGSNRDYITALAFSPDGRRLAAGKGERTIEIWNLETPRGSLDGQLVGGQRWEITHLAFSPDGTTLASGNPDGDLVLWDLNSQLPLGSSLVSGHGGLSALTYQSDGSLLTGYEDGSLLQFLITPENLLEIACGKADRPLSFAEQDQYFPQGGYRNACGK